MEWKKTIVVWDIEWAFHKVPLLLANTWLLNIANEVSIILVWDIVWGLKDGNLPMIQYCYNNRDRVRMILWNKDLLVQQLIKWEKALKEPVWATRIAQELWKRENIELQDFFMDKFESYIEKEKFIITHARPIPWKKLSKHSKKRLAWVWYKKSKNPLHEEWKIFIFWHHATEGFKINRDWEWNAISSIQVDSWCGRWIWNLSAVMLWKEQIRIMDSGWANINIDL